MNQTPWWGWMGMFLLAVTPITGPLLGNLVTSLMTVVALGFVWFMWPATGSMVFTAVWVNLVVYRVLFGGKLRSDYPLVVQCQNGASSLLMILGFIGAVRSGFAHDKTGIVLGVVGGIVLLLTQQSLFGRAEKGVNSLVIRQKAEKGDAEAQCGLGVMHFMGKEIRQDYAEALKWYRKAANQGYSPAQFMLGGMYIEGVGVPQDFTEGARWIRKAADQGHVEAQYNLGVMFSNGDGFAKDSVEAKKWYGMAASQGHTGAKKILRSM